MKERDRKRAEASTRKDAEKNAREHRHETQWLDEQARSRVSFAARYRCLRPSA